MAKRHDFYNSRKRSGTDYFVALDLNYVQHHPDAPIPFKLTTRGRLSTKSGRTSYINATIIILASIVLVALLFIR